MFGADSINRLERGIRWIRALHWLILLSMSLCLNSIALAGAGGAAKVNYRTVAVTGKPAPGTEPGVLFWLFTTPLNHDIMHPVIAQNGDAGFVARLIGAGPPPVDATNRNGVWAERNGALALIIRSGTQAPGVEPGVVFNGFASDYIPTPPGVSPTTVVFGGELSGPGINFANGSGTWKSQAGQITLVARNGAHAPGTPTGVYFTSVGGGKVDNESVTLFGTVAGPGVTSTNNDGIWSDRSGALALIVREADPAPGTSSGVVFGGGVFGTGGYTFPGIATNQSSQLAVQANLLGSGVTAFNDQGVWAEANGELTLIAREGDQPPGTEPGVYFGSANGIAEIDSLSINSAGRVIFTSRLSPPFHHGMFSTRHGELELVVRTGYPAPAPQGGMVFSSFYSPSLNDAGKIAFLGSAGSIHGIWSDRAGGPLEPLVQSGQQVPGQTQGVTFSNSGVSTFQPRAFNAAGQVLFYAGFDDPKSGNGSALMLDDPETGLHLLAVMDAEFDVFGDGSDMRTILRIVPGGLSQDGQVAFRLDFTDDSSGHFAASIEPSQPCPADVNSSGSVNVDDLLAVIGAWGQIGGSSDITGDNIVNVDDLLAVISAWGPCP
jgi:hypothetical protein